MFARVFSKLGSRTSDFRDDTQGSILPVFAVISVLLIVIAGAGVDYSRAVNERSRLSAALDSAVLTVAAKLSSSVMTDDEILALLKAVFEENLKGVEDIDAALANLAFSLDRDLGVIEASSLIPIPTNFVSLGGIGPESFDVGVGSTANYSQYDVELSLIVDVTGSMSGDMTALKEASIGLIDTLIPAGTDPDDSKVRISLIPYSEGVNLGTYATTVTNGVSSRCVTERAGINQFTDARYDYDPDRPKEMFFGGGSSGCASSSVIQPLTPDRKELTNSVNALRATGYTAGQTGIQWGWYTLSPNWTNLWPSESDPEPYTNDDVLKFAIIMTDGAFNTYYDQTKTKIKKFKKCKKKYGKNSDKCWEVSWDDHYQSGYNGEPSKRARALCDNMKNEDIKIYTVYFGSNTSSSEAKVMKYCSEGSGTFNAASSSAALISAFGNIAKKIQSIYLSQ